MLPSQPMDDPGQPPAHRTGKGRQERSLRTRGALLHAAAEQFETNGYERTRLSEVTAAAGVTSGALHFHFPNKQELADAVEETALHHLHQAARQTPHTPHNALQTLIDTTHALARTLHHDVITRAGLRLNSDARERTCLNLRHTWQSYVQTTLTHAATQGTLTPHTTPWQLAQTITGATIGYETLARHNKNWLTPPTITNLFHHLLHHTVTPTTLTHLHLNGTPPTHP
ncbi:TetR/AcrR family transcriptional regulator [Streptomyces sp. NBC_01218]|uniref:ScbR family autoregulator-binding transcription factor n=1 Tax=unclassified Streptomyces TaxID=2593676 RepID=UPI0023B9B9AA|nr:MULTISPECIES: ScbR family autoregulator-binding transcription factor [unclassified Streptomyces]WEH38101.1 ScbR family autoregulator-binding transcription factor [Streptomyces sp. AM 2-1-1]WEH43450.1 ScbR family autoregulator-binding transcription factor [Streptomyces sp. AM 2-1-1]WSQ49758.1 TetR/AcrR family transcriptional regulator [Streptomyces sp. NBC_01218]WSQ55083.1 TetR/AcrR family transcriptional regulator [Streptomyces sp. NBC_01218]